MSKLTGMNLSEYIKLERGNASSLACKLGISPSYLSQLAVPDANVSPARCVEIEQATNKQVPRQDLRPADWQAIWPELVTTTPAATKPDRRKVDIEAAGVDGLHLQSRRAGDVKA